MRITAFLIPFFMINLTFGQIITSPNANNKVEQPSKKQKAQKNKNVDSLNSTRMTSVYLTVNWSNTFRDLKSNGDLFGEPLGKKVDEVSLNTWSYAFGLRNQFHKHFYWDGGLAYMKNGEQYKANLLDTSYVNSYQYIAMPLKMNFTYGKKLRLIVGAGLSPALFLKFKEDKKWKTAGGEEKSESRKTKEGYNSFVLSTLVNIGVEYKFAPRWSALLLPEARWQLTNSNDKYAPYRHKSIAYGLTFGLTFAL